MATPGRANYFYCVRVTNPVIHTGIEEALEGILDKDPQYTNFCYTKEMLHVTLCEVCLPTEEDIAVASKLLQTIKLDLQANRPQSELCIKGISDFHKAVMIAKVEHKQEFRDFADMVKTAAKKEGIKVNEAHDFNPHMTILKVSGVKAKKAKVDKLNPWLYVNLKETLFGYQKVESVHLCKMGASRRRDGFYETPSEIFLS